MYSPLNRPAELQADPGLPQLIFAITMTAVILIVEYNFQIQ